LRDFGLRQPGRIIAHWCGRLRQLNLLAGIDKEEKFTFALQTAE
jgi:hypothetical protein